MPAVSVTEAILWGAAYGFASMLPLLVVELSEWHHSRQMLRMLERGGFVTPNPRGKRPAGSA